jgi:predicted transcriptional regulator
MRLCCLICLLFVLQDGSPPDVWLQLLERCAKDPTCQPKTVRILAQQLAEQRSLTVQLQDRLAAQEQLVSDQQQQMSDQKQRVLTQEQLNAEQQQQVAAQQQQIAVQQQQIAGLQGQLQELHAAVQQLLAPC